MALKVLHSLVPTYFSTSSLSLHTTLGSNYSELPGNNEALSNLLPLYPVNATYEASHLLSTAIAYWS